MVADVRLQVYKIDGVEILYLYVLITKSKDKFPKMQFVITHANMCDAC